MLPPYRMKIIYLVSSIFFFGVMSACSKDIDTLLVFPSKDGLFEIVVTNEHSGPSFGTDVCRIALRNRGSTDYGQSIVIFDRRNPDSLPGVHWDSQKEVSISLPDDVTEVIHKENNVGGLSISYTGIRGEHR